MFRIGVLTLLTGFAAALPMQTHAELLTNPGFEDNGGGLGEGWGSFGAAGFNAFFGANGHASLFMDNAANTGGVFQAGIAAVPGATYTFALTDVRIESNADANVQFGLEYYLGDDATSAGPADFVAMPLTPTGDGLTFSTNGTAPAGAAFVRPVIKFDGVNPAYNQQSQANVFVFDASLVPEPASLALLGLGGLTLLRRRASA